MKKEMHMDTNLSEVGALKEDDRLKRHLVRPFAGVPRNVWDFHFNTLNDVTCFHGYKTLCLHCNNVM